jgi:hypothetical protein
MTRHSRIPLYFELSLKKITKCDDILISEHKNVEKKKDLLKGEEDYLRR